MVAPRLHTALLVERPVVCGALYGVAVYFVMQLIVLPLSAVPWKVSFPASRLASGLVAHVACVGLPIALAIRWADASPADKDCQGTALTVQDNLVDVGVEESFGETVVRMDNPTLYDRICGCNSWPVQAQLEDVDGNATSGRVVANVIHP